MAEEKIIPQFKEGLVEEPELELYKEILLTEKDELENLKFRFQRKCFEDIFNKLENINYGVQRSAEVFENAASQLKKLLEHFKGIEEL